MKSVVKKDLCDFLSQLELLRYGFLETFSDVMDGALAAHTF